MKSSLVIFTLFLLINALYCFKIQKSQNNLESNKNQLKLSSQMKHHYQFPVIFNMTFDDVTQVVKIIYVNGSTNDITNTALQGTSGLGSWLSLKTYNFLLGYNDIISVTGVNNLLEGGFLGDLFIGNVVVKSNASTWDCGSDTTAYAANNGVSSNVVDGHVVPGITNDSYWLSATSNYSSRAPETCTYKLTTDLGIWDSIKVTADAQLISVSVNGKNIQFTGDYNNVLETKSSPPLNLNIGDLITIVAKKSNLKSNNPAGIIASYVLANSTTTEYYYTNNYWVCNGQYAINEGKNSETSNFWRANDFSGTRIPDIHDYAEWIWSSDNATTATCTFSINSMNDSIYYTSDGVITNVSVNGAFLRLPGFTNRWDKVKYNDIDGTAVLKKGDVIEIDASNESGDFSTKTEGLIASISYHDGSNIKTINTDSTWTCDGAKANVIASNGSTTSDWYNVLGQPLPNIDPSANWIWGTKNSATTKCRVTLP